MVKLPQPLERGRFDIITRCIEVFLRKQGEEFGVGLEAIAASIPESALLLGIPQGELRAYFHALHPILSQQVSAECFLAAEAEGVVAEAPAARRHWWRRNRYDFRSRRSSRPLRGFLR